MVIKAVVFDLDGVTVDSQPAWFEAYRLAAKKFGFEYSNDLAQLTRGIGVIKSARNLVEHYGIPEKNAEFLHLAKESYKDLFYEKTKLIPGVVELLERLRGNFKLALASSSPRFIIEQNFAKFPQLKKFFEVSVAGDEVENTKPAPDIFLLTAKKLEILPENCVVIEDSPAGVEAAKATGMFCIGLLDAGPKKQDISTADKQVQNLKEITPEVISSF